MTDQDVFEELRENDFFWIINNSPGKWNFQVRHRPSSTKIEGFAENYESACLGLKMAQDQILENLQEATSQ